jgi:hypothetical protein
MIVFIWLIARTLEILLSSTVVCLWLEHSILMDSFVYSTRSILFFGLFSGYIVLTAIAILMLSRNKRVSIREFVALGAASYCISWVVFSAVLGGIEFNGGLPSLVVIGFCTTLLSWAASGFFLKRYRDTQTQH